MHGNTWYVGTDGLSSFLLESDDGLVLVDGGLPQSAALIDANVRELGFDPADIHDKGGLGLISMQERADKIGGHLTVHSAPGEGTRVRVSVGVPTSS